MYKLLGGVIRRLSRPSLSHSERQEVRSEARERSALRRAGPGATTSSRCVRRSSGGWRTPH